MVQVAVTKPFRMEIMWTIWLTVTCIIRTATIATITALYARLRLTERAPSLSVVSSSTIPDATRGVMILDSPLPGIAPWNEVKANPSLWHFRFHQTPNLPERLLAGRQFIYFREFFDRLALNRQAITDTDVAHYARAYAARSQLRAGLEFYRRAYPASETFNASQRSPIDVPIVLAGGDHAMGILLPRLADSLRQHGCINVIVEAVKDSGHWVVDEQPGSGGPH
jgi:pimeloyl-ACP methyl ester carboxylesterase